MASCIGRSGIVALAVLVLVGAASANSVVLTFQGTVDATNPGKYLFEQGARKAEVYFAFSGSTLTVRLLNTSMADAYHPEDNLTAVFWDMGTNPALTAQSAMMGSSSVAYMVHKKAGLEYVTIPDDDLSGEWAYKKGAAGVPAEYVLSSVGMDDSIGGGDIIDPTKNLQGPLSPDGMQFGILGTGDTHATMSGGMQDNIFVSDEVVFSLTGLSDSFSLEDISNVWFHYGTSGVAIPPSPIPEPVTLAGLAIGMAVAGLSCRRRRIA